MNNSPIIGWVACLLIVVISLLNSTYVAIADNTSSGGSSSLRDWLSSLQSEASLLESKSHQLEKSIALLVNSNSTIVAQVRTLQLSKIKKALESLNLEIQSINQVCSTKGGPDCNVTCLNGLNGGECAVPQSSFSGTLNNIPMCDSKCINCTSPGICSNCTGNWNGTTCSTCKTGWYGSDCNSNFTLILNSTQIIKFTNTIMSNASITYSKLLFKASRDGFSVSTFHSKCDNKGPTIVIVKSTSGAIFGGYTFASWQSTQTNVAVLDTSAYIFSLISSTKEERFTKLINQNGYYYNLGTYRIGENAIINGYSLGPTFGGGNDFTISDNSNSNTNSFSNLCHTYCTTSMAYTSTAALSYLAGSNKFQVADYEVYST